MRLLLALLLLASVAEAQTMRRIEPLTPDAVLLSGDQPLARGDRRMRLERDKTGRERFVAEDADGENARAFERDPNGVVRVLERRDGALRLAPPSARPPFALDTTRSAPPRLGRQPSALPPPYQITLAIETDNELWAKFGSDAATRAYVLDLVAAVSTIYQRDVQATVQIGFLQLWPTSVPDPWMATDPGASLDELKAYFTSAHNLDPSRYAAVMFVSGKPVQGGVGYVNTLCQAPWNMAATQVNGSFNTATTDLIWDVVVVAHELGHVVASPHTHCYAPPVDECWNKESGCYAGSVVCSKGTVMSYCHLLCGGLSDLMLDFGTTVSTKLLSGLSRATCVLPVSASTTTTTVRSTTSTFASTTTTTAGGTTTTLACKPWPAPCVTGAECCGGRCAYRRRFGRLTCLH